MAYVLEYCSARIGKYVYAQGGRHGLMHRLLPHIFRSDISQNINRSLTVVRIALCLRSLLINRRRAFYPMRASMLSLHLCHHNFSPHTLQRKILPGPTRGVTYLGPNLLIAQITLPLHSAITPTPVNSHPSPIALISGCAATAPTAEKILRTKLLAATPEEARRGMNSVSMVVAMAKMSMEPMPKKKLAISCERFFSHIYRQMDDRPTGTGHITPFSAVQPYQIRAAG